MNGLVENSHPGYAPHSRGNCLTEVDPQCGIQETAILENAFGMASIIDNNPSPAEFAPLFMPIIGRPASSKAAKQNGKCEIVECIEIKERFNIDIDVLRRALGNLSEASRITISTAKACLNMSVDNSIRFVFNLRDLGEALSDKPGKISGVLITRHPDINLTAANDLKPRIRSRSNVQRPVRAVGKLDMAVAPDQYGLRKIRVQPAPFETPESADIQYARIVKNLINDETSLYAAALSSINRADLLIVNDSCAQLLMENFEQSLVKIFPASKL
jgi:hypothetical protein